MIGSVHLPLAFAVLLASSTVASACSCGQPDPKAVLASSAMVFDGALLDQTIGTDPAGKRAAVIRVRVGAMVKGARPASGVVTIYSHPEPAMCGVQYPPKFKGRFGASRDGGALWTDNCTHFSLNLEYFSNPK